MIVAGIVKSSSEVKGSRFANRSVFSEESLSVFLICFSVLRLGVMGFVFLICFSVLRLGVMGFGLTGTDDVHHSIQHATISLPL